MSRPGFSLIVLALVAIAEPRPTQAQPASDAVDVADLFAVRTIADVRLSPDGRHVAYTVLGLPRDGSGERLRSHVRVASVDGNGDRAVVSDEHVTSRPAWSPDGRSLAFLSDESGKTDVWIVPAAGGPPRQVTKAETRVSSFVWAPDGRRIAFVMADALDPAEEARRRIVTLSGDAPPPSRLWIASLDGRGEAGALTDASVHVRETPAWSPDGNAIAVQLAPDATLDAMNETELTLVDVASRERTVLAYSGPFAMDPIFSPDGTWIVTGPATERSIAPGIHAVPLDGTDSRLLGEADHYTEIAGWSADGGILATHQVGTERHVVRYALDGGEPVVLYRGPLVVSGLHLSRSGAAAFAGESLDTPAEVYVTALNRFEPAAVTAVNADLAIAPFGKTEVVAWTSTDGTTVEGLLTLPVGHSPARREPLLVVAHAGGETFTRRYVGDPFAGSHRAYAPPVFSSRGYAVLRVNQRGGGLAGYGSDAILPMFRAKVKANPDILAGVDTLIARGIADPDRVAIMGWSNGGLVTASLITQTDRFAAASILAGFPYLTLQAGTNPWMSPDLGAEPWEDVGPYLEHGPAFALDRVRTPTLILQGDADPAVPAAQAQAMHGSLVKLGGPTELALYPGMGHVPATRSQIADIVARNLAWFDEHVMGRRTAADAARSR